MAGHSTSHGICVLLDRYPLSDRVCGAFLALSTTNFKVLLSSETLLAKITPRKQEETRMEDQRRRKEGLDEEGGNRIL